MEDASLGTRVLSSRRSKPDMAALVDQHKPISAYIKPKRPEILIENRIPIVAIESLNSDDSASSTFSSEPPSFSNRKRTSRPPAHRKRLKTMRLKVVANGSSSHPENTDRLRDSQTISPSSPVHTDSESNDDLGLSTTNTSEDESDDNVPLSSFIPTKTAESHESDPPAPSPPPPPPPTAEQPCTSPEPVVPPVVLCQCTKPAVNDDPRWDGQYCSPECLIAVCHRAFEFWLRVHQDQSNNNSNNNNTDSLG